MTLGTAKIITRNGSILLTYTNTGSFLTGERTFGSDAAAREFCRERGLRVV